MTNIEQVITTLEGIRDGIKDDLKSGAHVLKGLEKRDEVIVPVKIATGHFPNAAGHLQMAIDNLKGYLAKAAEVKADSDKLAAPQAEAKA